MPRALWKGSLAFGLVNIPIELHTAVRGHIRGRAKGKSVGLAPLARPWQAEVVDLMERLRRSLAGARKAGKRPKTSRKPSAKKPRHAA